MTKKTGIPKTPGACADRMYALKLDKSKAQKVVDDIAAEQAAIEEHLIKTLPADDAEGVIGKVAKAVIQSKTIPVVDAEDGWRKVYAAILVEALAKAPKLPPAKLAAYLAEHAAWDLLTKRLNTKAVGDRWEAGETIPGLTRFVKKSVSLTKR
jgi:hypothetical protein